MKRQIEPNNRSTRVVSFRTTHDEYVRLVNSAAELKLSVSDYLLYRLYGKGRPSTDPPAVVNQPNASTRVVHFRVPYDEYMRLVNGAVEKRFALSEYVIHRLYGVSVKARKVESHQVTIASQEKSKKSANKPPKSGAEQSEDADDEIYYASIEDLPQPPLDHKQIKYLKEALKRHEEALIEAKNNLAEIRKELRQLKSRLEHTQASGGSVTFYDSWVYQLEKEEQKPAFAVEWNQKWISAIKNLLETNTEKR